MMLPRRFAAIACLLMSIGSATVSYSQVKLPKPPDTYEVQLRYLIVADRIQRFRQFDEMTTFFQSLGFKQLETEESETDAANPGANRMAGTVPSARARDLLRERHVRAILLSPAGFKIPEASGERVKVLIELEKALPFRQQQLLHNQVVQLLTDKLGYRDGISYDHRSYTILRGTIDATSVPSLLLDLRTVPNGWFVSQTPLGELPQPLRDVTPIRLVEITPDPEKAPAPLPPVQPLPKLEGNPVAINKLSPELQRFIAANPAQPVRLEVLLNAPPATREDEIRLTLIAFIEDLLVEGRLGSNYTIKLARAADAVRVANLPNVTAIRLPRAARPSATPAPAAPSKETEPESKEKVSLNSVSQTAAKGDAIRESGLDRLRAIRKQGAGTRIVLIDTDFTGFKDHLGKGLPAKTKLIDMTAERQSTVLPEPTSTPEGQMGHGTHCALAASLAAPEAELTLVRVDPGAPYQLQTVLRFVAGDFFEPLAFQSRQREFDLELKNFRSLSEKILEEYRRALDKFEDSPEAEAERKRAQQAVKDLDLIEAGLLERVQRLQRLEADLVGLKGSDVVVSPLVWDSGHAFDGSSFLSQLIDDKLTVAKPVIERRKVGPLPKTPLWFNAVGDTRGQSWLGQFADADGNGVMEFVGPEGRLPKDRWTREMNFLAFESSKGESAVNLPAGARVRVTIQWREPHDPELDEAEYREPTTSLSLWLLRQRDPSGESVPSDEVEVAGMNQGPAVRLLKGKQFGIYEKTLETTIGADGRYALRVDGIVPKTNRPRNTPYLPANEIQFDLTPRVFVEVLDNDTRAKGRVVFQDYQSLLGGVGMPADARQVHAIGAVSLDRVPRPFSAVGGGPGVQILQKPDVWSFDELPIPAGPARGTSLSTSFAGGLAASMLSAGAGHSDFLNSVGIKRRQVFEVSEDWFKRMFGR